MYDERDKSHRFHGDEIMYLKCCVVKYKTEKDLLSLACIKKGCYDSIHFTFAQRGNGSCGQQ